MPSLGQILPYVLPDVGSDRRWCLWGIQDHPDGPARSTSIQPISDIALSGTSIPFFHARWCVWAHDSLVAKSIFALAIWQVQAQCERRF
ncbi:MAG TPA: hypothetical protein VHZ51_29890 [Ktedonobacteraceae bacterium]|nr:hypothetical protein [Ktedonobacteraceae bacterium]